MFRIAFAQINSRVGDLEGNTKKIITHIKEARKKNVDLIVFPELTLCGYPPEDLLLKKHFVNENTRYLQKIIPHTKDIVALVGFVDREKDMLFNACAVVQNKRLEDMYHKIHLPNYGVFDEKRYFTGGDSFKLYTLGTYTFTISICEDAWKESFVSLLKKQKLDFVVNISASPFHLGKISLREKVLSSVARQAQTFVCYCNLVGGQDELVFDGTSKIYSPQGTVIGQANSFSEDMFLFILNKKKKYLPCKRVLKKEEEIYQALRLGLSDYVKKNGFKKIIVGVSGGIDSGVVVSLAALALGAENVTALIMPSRFTSSQTLKDARKICKNLGVRYHEVNIEEVFSAYLHTLRPYLKKKGADKTEENLQARIRGNILMAFSNKFGYLVLNTGNKSELSCGYCTLYGDMVGGFGVLKDVPKTLVYKLAHYINVLTNKKVIPESVMKRPPSAELKHNQRDTDTLPPYKVLDPILKLYVEDDFSLEEIVARGFNESIIRQAIAMVDTNEYKRRQAPIGIKITPRAFGKDRRMPITNRFSP